MKNLLNLEPFNPHNDIAPLSFEDLTDDFLAIITRFQARRLPLGIRVFVKLDSSEETKARAYFQAGKTLPHIPTLTHGFAFSFSHEYENFSTVRKTVHSRDRNKDICSFIVQPEKGKSLGDLWHSLKAYRENPISFKFFLEDPEMNFYRSLKLLNFKTPLFSGPRCDFNEPEKIKTYLREIEEYDYVHYVTITFSNGSKNDFYLTPNLKDREEYKKHIGKFNSFLISRVPAYKK